MENGQCLMCGRLIAPSKKPSKAAGINERLWGLEERRELIRGPLFDTIKPQTSRLGLAACWRRTGKRNLSDSPCFCPLFTRFHQVLDWSSWIALSNQQACGPSSIETPAGFLATGSPQLTFQASLSPEKLPVRYPFFLSSPCTNF